MESNTTPIPSFDLTENPKALEPGTKEWELMSRNILDAFESVGCALVKHDDVSGDDLRGLFAAAGSLFDLPIETKRRNTAEESLTTYPGSKPFVPLYEAQGVMNANDPEKAKAFTDLMWPEGNHDFCQTINSMSNKMLGILEIILNMIIDGYGVRRDDTGIVQTEALFHMIKYSAPATEEPALGLSEHSDINYLTILCQNEVNGLSIKSKQGDWIPVNPGNNHFVVFVGQALRAWSNGRLHPPFHQVIFRGHRDRLSSTVFLLPKPDQIVDTVPELVDDEHPRRYKPFTYGDFHDYSKRVFTDRENILQNYAGI